MGKNAYGIFENTGKHQWDTYFEASTSCHQSHEHTKHECLYKMWQSNCKRALFSSPSFYMTFLSFWQVRDTGAAPGALPCPRHAEVLHASVLGQVTPPPPAAAGSLPAAGCAEFSQKPKQTPQESSAAVTS